MDETFKITLVDFYFNIYSYASLNYSLHVEGEKYHLKRAKTKAILKYVLFSTQDLELYQLLGNYLKWQIFLLKICKACGF